MVKIMKIEKGGMKNAFNFLFRQFLEKNLVDMVLVSQETFSGDNMAQTLVKDVGKLVRINPLAPVMPVNSSKLIANITHQKLGKRIAAVLKPCEIRATIELAKFNQVSLDNLIIIGIDCPGVFSVKDYAKLVKQLGGSELLVNKFLKITEVGKFPLEGYMPRKACQICELPTSEKADLVVGTIGRVKEEEIFLQAQTPTGQKILNKLSLEKGKLPPGREKAILKLIKKRKEKRGMVFKEIQNEMGSFSLLLSQFSTCILCYNCRRVCPMCYCTECVFDTPMFKYQPSKYAEWAEKKGAIKLPKDMLLFHLTRMSHMIVSCVGCGQCEEACPNDLPLGSIFPAVADKVQEIFGYLPGKDVQEEPPLITFREEELEPR